MFRKGQQDQRLGHKHRGLVRQLLVQVHGLRGFAFLVVYPGQLKPRESREILERLEERSKRGFVPAYNLAVIHLVLNDKDAALNYLQKAYRERDWAMFVLKVEPRLDPLRSDPHFQALLQQLTFPN